MIVTNITTAKQLYIATRSNSIRQYKIYRWSKTISSPYLETFYIDSTQSGPMVLDDLIYIKNYLDPTLSFRRSCREGICGSCAMNVNGENTLACLEEVNTLEEAYILPLPHMKVIKDLVPDLTHFFKQYQSIQPWLVGAPKNDHTELFQTKTNRVLLDNLYECILCACCTTSCPSYWWNSSSYLGPSVLLQAFRWIIDSRDTILIDRLLDLYHPFKLFKCHQILNCTKVCPKHLNPALAIQKIKSQMYQVLHQLY